MTKHYPLPLVGEQFYQAAIGRCRVGDIIDVCRESGNPVDPLAIVARRRDGDETIGYVATDSFVRRVIHEDGEGVAAAVGSVFVGRRGFLEVSLLVSVTDEPADVVRYRADEANEYDPPALLPEPVETGSTGQAGFLGGFSPLQIAIGIAILFTLVRCMG